MAGGAAVTAATLAAVLAITGCSTPHRSAAPRTTTTTLIRADHWAVPAVSGPPSQANFCRLLTAMYRHEADLPYATPEVETRIIDDFVRTVPEALAEAPPDIAPAARTYLQGVAGVLSALERAGLDYRKVKPGTLAPFLLDPSIKAAGDDVLVYSQQQCHYTIGG